MRKDDFYAFFGLNRPTEMVDRRRNDGEECKPAVLLDTSVIIDGRIADIAATGFILGMFVVPRFVLNELQYVADSSDALRRNRGRRGLEILDRLQQNLLSRSNYGRRPSGSSEVDDKLVALPWNWAGPILTNDYNLNRVAQLQAVRFSTLMNSPTR